MTNFRNLLLSYPSSRKKAPPKPCPKMLLILNIIFYVISFYLWNLFAILTR